MYVARIVSFPFLVLQSRGARLSDTESSSTSQLLKQFPASQKAYSMSFNLSSKYQLFKGANSFDLTKSSLKIFPF